MTPYLTQAYRDTYCKWITDSRHGQVEAAIAVGERLYRQFHRRCRVVDQNERVLWENPRLMLLCPEGCGYRAYVAEDAVGWADVERGLKNLIKHLETKRHGFTHREARARAATIALTEEQYGTSQAQPTQPTVSRTIAGTPHGRRADSPEGA